MNLLARIKPARALLMRVHYEIVQQIINRLSKYLSALKICIFHTFLFLHPASHMQLYVCVPSILIFQQNQKWRCKTDAAICQICHTLTHCLHMHVCLSMCMCVCVCVCESALCSGFLNLHVNSIARTWKCILALLLLLLPLHAELLLLLLHFNKFMILFAFFFALPLMFFCRSPGTLGKCMSDIWQFRWENKKFLWP